MADYRRQLESKRQLDDAIVRSEQQITQCKTALVKAYESWYSGRYPKKGKEAEIPGADIQEQYENLQEGLFRGDGEAYTFYANGFSAICTVWE